MQIFNKPFLSEEAFRFPGHIHENCYRVTGEKELIAITVKFRNQCGINITKYYPNIHQALHVGIMKWTM